MEKKSRCGKLAAASIEMCDSAAFFFLFLRRTGLEILPQQEKTVCLWVESRERLEETAEWKLSEL